MIHRRSTFAWFLALAALGWLAAVGCTIDDRAVSTDLPALSDGDVPGQGAAGAGGSGTLLDDGGVAEPIDELGEGSDVEELDDNDVGANGETGAGVPGLSADVDSFDFGGQEVAIASTPFVWNVRNTAATAIGPLELTQLVPPQYLVSSTCEGSLAPNTSCQISVQYTPSAPGDHTGSLRLSNGDQTVWLNLTGRGQFRVTITKVGTGTGTVLAPGLECGATCSALFDPGSYEFVAETTNGSNSFFSGWIDASSYGCGGPTRDCTLSVQQSIRMSARFSPQNNNLIFLSSQKYFPTLGSTAAYDAECNRLADAAGINDAAGTGFVAGISGTESFWNRIPASARGWLRMDSFPFGDQRESLLGTQPSIYYGVHYDELGRIDQYGAVWTGTTSAGAVTSNCNGWSTTGDAVLGGTGTGRSGPYWLDSGPQPCSSAGTSGEPTLYSVYCLGIRKSAPISVSRYVGKRIWVTNTSYVVGGGVTPDAKCQAERPSDVAQARAFIGYTGRPASAVLDPTANYVRPDGVYVGLGSDLARDEMFTGPWIAADGTVVPANTSAWTGAPQVRGQVPVASETCSDWQDPQQDGSGGVVGYSYWRAFRFFFGSICTLQARLYCIEV